MALFLKIIRLVKPWKCDSIEQAVYKRHGRGSNPRSSVYETDALPLGHRACADFQSVAFKKFSFPPCLWLQAINMRARYVAIVLYMMQRLDFLPPTNTRTTWAAETGYMDTRAAVTWPPGDAVTYRVRTACVCVGGSFQQQRSLLAFLQCQQQQRSTKEVRAHSLHCHPSFFSLSFTYTRLINWQTKQSNTSKGDASYLQGGESSKSYSCAKQIQQV